jgi:Flp pilus assembly protein TadG
MYERERAGSHSRERGTVIVQAALIMPFLLAIIFASVNLIIISSKSVRFQYDMTQVTREAFAKTKGDRGNLSWANYIQNNLLTRAQAAGLSSAANAGPFKAAITPTFRLSDGTSVSNWTPATPPKSGDIFYAEAQSTEAIFPSALLGLSSLQITLRARAIAFIQRTEDE